MANKKKRITEAAGQKRSTQGAPKDVEEYLARVPDPARSTLQKLRAAVLAVVPREATEAISYGIPAIKYKGTLVWFAAFSRHCSLFPTAEIIEAFQEELKGYTVSKGTIQFPLDRPLPVALIKKIVKARLAKVQKTKP